MSWFDVVDYVLVRASAALGAAIGSQLPEFAQQYLQRLGGHLGEAARQLKEHTKVAKESGITLTEMIGNFAPPSFVRAEACPARELLR